MKNSPTLMAQEKALERRKIGNFTGKTLGTEEEAAKKAWLHPAQNRTAVNAFKVQRAFMEFFLLLLFFFPPQLKAEEKLFLKDSVFLDRMDRENLRLKKKKLQRTVKTRKA